MEETKVGAWKCWVHGIGDRDFTSNGLVFATKEEAESYGAELLSRWYGADRIEARQSDEPPTHRFNYETYRAEPLPK
jgi:hypothetical protein